MGDASLRLRSLAVSAEGRDRRLPVAFRHLDVAGSVIGEVRVVFLVPPAQGNRRELGTPHVRLRRMPSQSEACCALQWQVLRIDCWV